MRKLDPNVDWELMHSDAAWIGVGILSVKISHEDDGVVIDVYMKDREDEDMLTGLWYTFDEALDWFDDDS